jgi:hypothetical protein
MHQHDNTPLTRAILSRFDRDRVAAIFEDTFPREASKVKTKAQQLDYLCPVVECEADAPPPPRGKRKFDAAQLNAQLSKAQGQATPSHQVYDLFHAYNSSIDEADKDFYEHCRTRYIRGATHASLCHIAYYVYAACYAISDEYTRSKIHAESNGNNRAPLEHCTPAADHFLYDLVAAYVEKRNE